MKTTILIITALFSMSAFADFSGALNGALDKAKAGTNSLHKKGEETVKKANDTKQGAEAKVTEKAAPVAEHKDKALTVKKSAFKKASDSKSNSGGGLKEGASALVKGAKGKAKDTADQKGEEAIGTAVNAAEKAVQ